MRQRRHCGLGTTSLAFIAGLVISYFCSSAFIIAVLTLAVIILGFLCKY